MTSPRGFREIEPTAADEEAAEEILETIEEALERVHPARVMFSTLIVAIITILLLGGSLWVVPYDGVTADVVYRQSGGGHIVLVELDNRGSRSIQEIEMSIRMVDEVGIEVGRTDFDWDNWDHTPLSPMMIWN